MVHDSEQPLGLTNVRFQTDASCNQKYLEISLELYCYHLM